MKNKPFKNRKNNNSENLNNSQAGASAGMVGDDVNVKSVNVAQYHPVDKYFVVIVPTTNIDHINSIELKNVESSTGKDLQI